MSPRSSASFRSSAASSFDTSTAESPVTRFISSIWRSSSSSGRSKSSVWVAIGQVVLTRCTWSGPSSPRSAASRSSAASTRSERLRLVPVPRAVASAEEQRLVGPDHVVELGPRLREHQGFGRAVEVLEHEACVLCAGLLRDLTLHDRDHRGDPHLLVAPPAERGGGPGTEKLHLGAVLG